MLGKYSLRTRIKDTLYKLHIVKGRPIIENNRIIGYKILPIRVLMPGGIKTLVLDIVDIKKHLIILGIL